MVCLVSSPAPDQLERWWPTTNGHRRQLLNLSGFHSVRYDPERNITIAEHQHVPPHRTGFTVFGGNVLADLADALPLTPQFF